MKTSDAFGVKARTRADILCFDKVVLWGAGSALGDCADAIGKDNIAAVFDSNEKLWGQTRKGFHILPPSELKGFLAGGAAVVISATRFQREIANDLLEKGVGEDRLFGNTCHAYERFRYIPETIDNNYESILATLETFDDEDSKAYFIDYIKFCLTRNPLYLKSNDLCTEPYRYNGFAWEKDSRNVIFDCGAYNGDTAKLFIENTSGNCEIYCFEPVAENYASLCSWITGEKLQNVYAFNVALGERNYRETVFSGENTGTIDPDFRGGGK